MKLVEKKVSLLVYLDKKKCSLTFTLTSFDRVKYNDIISLQNLSYLVYFLYLFRVSSYTQYRYIKLQLLNEQEIVTQDCQIWAPK